MIDLSYAVLKDPITHYLSIIFLSVLFLHAGVSKLLDINSFMQQLSAYELLPSLVLKLSSRLIPLVELSLALGLWFEAVQVWSAILIACLLVVYALAIVINLLRGRDHLDCGCQLGNRGQKITASLVFRNIVLLMFPLTILLGAEYRALTIVDFICIVFSALAAILLLLCIETLISQGPKTKELEQ